MDFIGLSVGAIQHYSYFILFILMLIEGPIVTLFASFAASFGIFNIYIIIILALFGNIIPDILYFHIGKHSRKKFLEKLLQKIGLTQKRILWMERNLKEHTKKAIILMKITPFVPVPGIMLAGFLGIPFRRFFSISIFVDFATVFIFAIVGYFSGLLGLSLVNRFNLERYLIFIIGVLAIFTYWISRKIYAFIAKKVKARVA